MMSAVFHDNKGGLICYSADQRSRAQRLVAKILQWFNSVHGFIGTRESTSLQAYKDIMTEITTRRSQTIIEYIVDHCHKRITTDIYITTIQK